jgi:chorismate mutase-like protein
MPTSEDPVRALTACRDSIDAVDCRIVELLSERTSIVQEIGRIKRSAQLPVYEPRREDQVFANVTSHNKGPLSDDALRRIFERIIDEMRKVQKDRMGEGA